MKLISVISTLYFLTGGASFSQEIVIMDLNGGKLQNPEGVFVQIRIDLDSVITFSPVDDKISISRSSCDSIADIIVGGSFIQLYHNQYLPYQFKLLDTLRVFSSPYVTHPSPIFLLDIGQEIDSLLIDQLGFAETVKQIGLPYTLSFNVFHADQISRHEKKYIKDVKKKYCEHLGIDNESINLIYENKAYTSNQLDFFASGTLITRHFINSQNTPWMKEQAEKYKLVLWLMINWTTESK